MQIKVAIKFPSTKLLLLFLGILLLCGLFLSACNLPKQVVVPIVDVDIEPRAWHSNPFREGAKRNVEKRSYQLTWTLSLGNGAQIEPAYKPPYFRAPGNHRYANAIQYQGPLADPQSEFHKFGKGNGVWNTGSFWVRYYAPDFRAGSLGGVPLPKVLYELPSGERFFLNADFQKLEESLNQTRKAWSTSGEDPSPLDGANIGWSHGFDILEAALAGVFQNVGKTTQADKAYGRDLVLGLTSHVIVFSRHEDRPSNAYPRNGVTWVDWGDVAHQGWVLRWLSVHPNWRDPQIVPDITNLPYKTTSWFFPLYDATLIGMNSYQGKLGSYQPQVHYLSKEKFEQLGSRVQAKAVPDWKAHR